MRRPTFAVSAVRASHVPPPLETGLDASALLLLAVIPMGTGTPSVGENIAECARVLETYRSRGLKFQMHGYGTNLEGPWQLVSSAIEDCHRAVHAQGVPRIATDIRIGTKDKSHPAMVKAAETNASTIGKGDAGWAKDLGENERKLESVARRLKLQGALEKGAGGSAQQVDGQEVTDPMKEGALPARPSAAERGGYGEQDCYFNCASMYAES